MDTQYRVVGAVAPGAVNVQRKMSDAASRLHGAASYSDLHTENRPWMPALVTPCTFAIVR